MSTAQPRPGTEQITAACAGCGERIRLDDGEWTHTGPPRAGRPDCHPGLVADFTAEKKAGLR